MNVIISLNQFDLMYCHFQEAVKNTVMENSNFIRLIYSSDFFMLNSIILQFKIQTFNIEKYFNKYKYGFDLTKNMAVVTQLCQIEKDILEKVRLFNKTGWLQKRPTYKLSEQLFSGNIKLFLEQPITNKEINYILKISGIWENAEEYGVTYKFMDSV